MSLVQLENLVYLQNNAETYDQDVVFSRSGLPQFGNSGSVSCL